MEDEKFPTYGRYKPLGPTKAHMVMAIYETSKAAARSLIQEFGMRRFEEIEHAFNAEVNTTLRIYNK